MAAPSIDSDWLAAAWHGSSLFETAALSKPGATVQIAGAVSESAWLQGGTTAKADALSAFADGVGSGQFEHRLDEQSRLDRLLDVCLVAGLERPRAVF